MLNKQTINKLNKLHEEALDNLTPKQIFLLMKHVTKDVIDDFSTENTNNLDNLMDYFMDQDIYTSYNALSGMFKAVNVDRVSLDLQLKTLKLNNIVQRNRKFINEFNSNFKVLKFFLKQIYKNSDDSETVKELNELIKDFYLDIWCAKDDVFVEIILKHREEIEKRNKCIKELVSEYKDLDIDDLLIKQLEANLKLLFSRLEEYYKNLEEFKTMSEDGFIFLKEKYQTDNELNLIYDFTEFDIKEAVNNES